MAVKGLDLVTRLPRMLEISAGEMLPAVSELVQSMTGAVLKVLERCPPALSADLLDRGIVLTGGGALLRGLARTVREASRLPVTVVDDPLTAVVRGLGRVLEDSSLAELRAAV